MQLEYVERLVNSVYDPRLSQVTRTSIEKELQVLKSNLSSVDRVLELFAATRQDHVRFFALVVAEDLVQSSIAQSNEANAHMRSALQNALLSRHQDLSPMIRNKLLKLLATFTTLHWPDGYSSLFQDIRQLLSAPETRSLGVSFLLYVTEDITSDSLPLPANRKQALLQSWRDNSPAVVYILEQMFELAMTGKHASPTTAYLSPVSPRDASQVASVADATACLRIAERLPLKSLPGSVISSILEMTQSDNNELSRSAIGCIMELLTRGLLDSETAWVLKQTAWSAYAILQKLPETPAADDQDDLLSDKTVDLMELLIKFHALRLEDMLGSDGVVQIVQAYLRFVIHKGQTSTFEHTMTPVFSLMSHLTAKTSATTQPAVPAEAYKSALCAFSADLLSKLQMVNTDAEGALDEDDHYLSFTLCVAEYFGRFAELFCNDCFNTTMTSALRIYGRCADVLSSQFDTTFQLASVLYNKFVEVLEQSVQQQLMTEPSGEIASIVQQLVSTLQCFVPWLAQCRSGNVGDSFGSSYARLVDCVICLLTSASAPPAVLEVSSRLLLSITTTVRPETLLSLESVQQLLSQCYSLSHLPSSCTITLYTALNNAIVLPFFGLKQSEQKYEQRSAMCSAFLAPVVEQFAQIPERRLGDAAQRSQSLGAAKALAAITRSVAAGSTATKACVYEGVQRVVQHSTSLVAMATQQHDTELLLDVLDLQVALFESVRTKLPSEFVQHTISQAAAIIKSPDLTLVAGRSNVSMCSIVNKFLSMIKVVVEENGKSMYSLFPSIIDMLTGPISQQLQELDEPSLHINLDNVMSKLLVTHWRFFFPTTMVQMFANSAAAVTSGHEALFVTVLRHLCGVLSNRDIETVRVAIQNLKELHLRWHLFSKDVWRQVLFDDTARLILSVVCEQSHDLLREDLLHLLCTIVLANFDTFQSHMASILSFDAFCRLQHRWQQELQQALAQTRPEADSCFKALTALCSGVIFYSKCSSSRP
ncbi:Exportin-6 [Sorochytrium milnesiophthora]